MKRTHYLTSAVAGVIALAGTAQAETFTVATILNANDVAVQAMKRWDDLLQEETDGRLKLNILAGGTLGGTRELVQQLSSGEIDVNLSSPVVLQEAAPAYQCLEAEYVFRDEDHGFAVWHGDIGQAASDAMHEDYGIQIAAVGRRGSRNVTSNVPVNAPDDLEGVKIRVTNSLRNEVFEAFGAQPAPMALSEVYGALRQGVFEAQENPLSTIHSLRFHEVQDYISMTQHIWTYTITYVNSDMYEGLSEEDRAVFDSTLADSMEWLNDAVAKEEKRIRDDIESSGKAQIVEPDTAPFAEIAGPIVAEFAAKNCAPGLLDRIATVTSE